MPLLIESSSRAFRTGSSHTGTNDSKWICVGSDDMYRCSFIAGALCLLSRRECVRAGLVCAVVARSSPVVVGAARASGCVSESLLTYAGCSRPRLTAGILSRGGAIVSRQSWAGYPSRGAVARLIGSVPRHGPERVPPIVHFCSRLQPCQPHPHPCAGCVVSMSACLIGIRLEVPARLRACPFL